MEWKQMFAGVRRKVTPATMTSTCPIPIAGRNTINLKLADTRFSLGSNPAPSTSPWTVLTIVTATLVDPVRPKFPAGRSEMETRRFSLAAAKETIATVLPLLTVTSVVKSELRWTEQG